jgi:hypothetical protein
LMPKINEDLAGNLEAAFQVGEQGSEDVEAYAVDAFLKYQMPVLETAKPALEGGLYYLSGDDPDTAKNEGWNPLWARYPQRSELYVFAYDAARWSNLIMPRTVFTATLNKWVSMRAAVSYLMAAEDNGPGTGEERGWLYQLMTDFNMGENLLMKKDKLTGHILFDILEPGDYYTADQQNTSLFARWQLLYTF